ncbi:MAG TPA: lytic transglycosylase domain-containing protein [Nitrospira sp.]|nr:lytic transglycosylase domain-containing protein [Nitrospira sp.]
MLRHISEKPSGARRLPARRFSTQDWIRGLTLIGMIWMGPPVSQALADTRPFAYGATEQDTDFTEAGARTDTSAYLNRYHRTLSNAELEGAVSHAAREHRLQPALLLAVIRAESSFNPVVVSRAGAVGLMQLVPETAIRHGVQNLYDTKENIVGGARHLRYLLDRFKGNLRLALAAYNAGERKVDQYRRIPPFKETQLYVQKVMSYYRDYRKGGWVAPVTETTAHVAPLQSF